MDQEYDSPWKQIIETYFQDFLAFFYKDIHDDIDWSAGYTFLDKELETVVRDAALGTRYVDKLVQVTRLNGETGYVYLHIEVQGDQEDHYGRRVFGYFYRLLDKYGDRVVSLSVLADTRENWRPETYVYELWGCRVEFAFPTVKLLDYLVAEAVLAANPNPFALVVQAHLSAKKTTRRPGARREDKLRLVKELYRRGLGKDDILNLFAFIDWVMALPEEDEERFWLDLKTYTGEEKMAYVTSVERIGMKKGRAEGYMQALKETLLDLLRQKFHDIPDWVIRQIDHARDSQLKQWIVDAGIRQNLDEVFQPAS